MKDRGGTEMRRQGRDGRGLAFLAVVLLLSAWAGCAYAETGARPVASRTWTVTDSSDHGENTLRGIIGKATASDVVVFAPDIAEIRLQGELSINKTLTIMGSSSRKVTIRQTTAGVRVLSVSTRVSVTLRHLTITGGRQLGRAGGGGIVNRGTLVIDHCDMVDNRTEFIEGGIPKGSHGGGIFNLGTLTIKNSLVKGNSANDGGNGGGVCNSYGAHLTMEDCVVEENTCTRRGGGINNDGTMGLYDSTIRNNQATGTTYRSSGFGGGIFSNNASMGAFSCTVDGNSAMFGGGVYSYGHHVILVHGAVTNNTALEGGGIDSREGDTILQDVRVQGNTPDQLLGFCITDDDCVIGGHAGTASVAVGGIPEGVSPGPRKTTGETDVTAVENDLENPESALFTAVKNALSADLGEPPGDVSAGLFGLNATLYNAFAYENVPLADTSGKGKLEVEFTASWPKNVRYYAALAEYEGAAAGTRSVKGYAIPDRGVQFEIKPGQPLPDGVTPPGFYEEGEGLMTWRNVVEDDGPFDHNRQVGLVTFRVASIRAEAQTASSGRSGGAGCSAGFVSPFALLLAIPLLFLRKRGALLRKLRS